MYPDISAGLPRTLANKWMLQELCSQIGVPCPKAMLAISMSDVHEFAESVGFPVVVKAAAAWLSPKLKVSIAHSERELIDVWRRVEGSKNPNLLIQEYIPHGDDWFFHGYCNGASDCLAGFTGMKLRSFPPHTGITTLGRSVTNDVLLHQAETLLKAISYAGVMDIDYRFDKRDGQYKLLDFNPRIGAQFRLLVDDNGLDVARAFYRDLSGQMVRRSRQIDGRVFVVEPYDLRTSVNYFWRGELSASAWLHSFKGRREFAWFSWDDPLPFLMAWSRLAIRGVARIIRIGPFKFRYGARRRARVGQACKSEQGAPIAQGGGLLSRSNPIAKPMWQYLVRPWRWGPK